jgi:hypothetical protein
MLLARAEKLLLSKPEEARETPTNSRALLLFATSGHPLPADNIQAHTAFAIHGLIVAATSGTLARLSGSFVETSTFNSI